MKGKKKTWLCSLRIAARKCCLHNRRFYFTVVIQNTMKFRILGWYILHSYLFHACYTSAYLIIHL